MQIELNMLFFLFATPLLVLMWILWEKGDNCRSIERTIAMCTARVKMWYVKKWKFLKLHADSSSSSSKAKAKHIIHTLFRFVWIKDEITWCLCCLFGKQTNKNFGNKRLGNLLNGEWNLIKKKKKLFSVSIEHQS